jgi:hypothetical protein
MNLFLLVFGTGYPQFFSTLLNITIHNLPFDCLH